MDYLWTPWRMKYLQSEKAPGCVFCRVGHDQPEHDATNLVVWRGEHAFLVLNKYPYNTGHVMAVPYQHAASPEDLTVEALSEILLLTNRTMAALRSAMKPHGFNLGVNIGKPAGAGIESHVHLHIVPRWEGDANFMSITAGTRVLPQTLEQTYELLHRALRAS